VAALILRGEKGGTPGLEVLICQRRANQAMSLRWEFPGGKIEPGESDEEALIRELDEELGITAVIGEQVARVRHHYRNGGSVDLRFYEVREYTGTLDNRIFNDIRWSSMKSLPDYDFLTADEDLIQDLAQGKLL
jgi:8-oxo-dGTP diphosphatase